MYGTHTFTFFSKNSRTYRKKKERNSQPIVDGFPSISNKQ